MRNILFITWDGPDTSYLEGLFLPIFQRLQVWGYRVHVLQFSWGEVSRRKERESLCRIAGIAYRHVTVARSPRAFGPLLSALFGAYHIRRAVRDWEIGTLMPRSLMPALAVQQLRRSEQRSLGIVFDADGLAIDERVDFEGLSPHGLTYRLLRDVEAEMLRLADVVLTRTEAARAVLQARAGAGMVPERYLLVSNGVDPQPFIDALAALPSGDEGPFTLCYSGSIGPQYRLSEMLELARRLKERVSNLRFHIFTRAQEEVAAECGRRGLAGAEWIECRALRVDEVPQAMASCDLGLSLRLQHFSTQAVLPIKLGEYLLAGLPVIGTPGVGNSDRLAAEGVFRSAEPGELDSTLDWVCSEVIPNRTHFRQKCHNVGIRYFSVDEAAGRYATALRSYADTAGTGKR